jgi:predicted  nucleic acid-binding Zn-ribbon protein
MKSKGNSAIVPVDAGICGGCHMKLVTATLNGIKAEDNMVHCEQCGRILYFA